MVLPFRLGLWALSVVLPVSAVSVAWNSDSIAISVTPSSDRFALKLQASRRVISASVGHFKLGITQDGLEHKTSCISYGASSIAVSEALDSLDPVDDLGGSKVVRKGDGSSGYSYRYLYDISASNSSGNMVDSVELKLIGSGVDIGCSRLSTLGYWDEATNWNSGMVPASNDEVTIPADAGFVTLTKDTTISLLRMNGGALVTHDTTCQEGWTPAPGGSLASFGSRKCYRLFTDTVSWTTAQNTCASSLGPQEAGSRGGALRSGLVTVQGLEENRWVGRMCRGDTLDRGCWIGLARRYKNRADDGDGFMWTDLRLAVGESQYRSWAIREPSDFGQGEWEENCVATQGSRKRAFEQGEAQWYDTNCEVEMPFICQAFGISTPFKLTVSTELDLAGGYVVGGGMLISSNLAQVSGDEGEFGLLHGATLLNSAAASMEWSAPSTVGWGGNLYNKGTLTFSGAGVSFGATADGVGFLKDNPGAWPVVVNEEGAEVVIEAGSEVALEWLLWNQGGQVSVEGKLESTGGGYSSSGTLAIEEGGEAKFSNSSFIMHQTEVVVITLQADREVTGQDVELPVEKEGYYRLAFGGEETGCIDYHSSENSLQEALEELLSIEDERGVTVRRDGNGKLEQWQNGYRYVVTFDGARGLSNTNALILSCAGSAADCGCTDIIGGIARPEGSRIGCGSAIFGEERASTSAEFFESQCRVQAKIDLKTIRKGDETAVNGGGILTFSDGGQYFLPSVVEADVGVKAGAEVVCSAWTAEITGVVNVSSSGVLWFAGADWDAIDAVHLLHAKPDTPGRNRAAISSPPVFTTTVIGDVTVENGGEIRLAATPSAVLDIMDSLTLAGGGLAGRGRVVVQGPTLLVPSASGGDGVSTLKSGVTLDMHGGGRWSGGDLQARDGATVVNRGLFTVTAEGGAIFGAGGDFGARALVDFNGVGWYANPLCGDNCTAEPSWENAIGGEVVGGTASDALLCFVLFNEGTVRVEDGGRLEWCGAGEGRGSGIIVLTGSNSTLVFSDGSFAFEAAAKVLGGGTLEFSGGTEHELPDAISPLVKVSGDAVVTFVRTELSLERGLTVTDMGTLVFLADTATTYIAGNLTLEGEGLILFPPPTVEASLKWGGGSMDPPWGSGEGDLGGVGWGGASRSSVGVEGRFTWTGGVMSGNARVLCIGESMWAGNSHPKVLLDSLHLVSQGDVEWSSLSGDIVVSFGAAFINHGGTLLLKEADSSKGTITTGSWENSPRIRAPRKGEEVGWEKNSYLVQPKGAVAAGGAGSAGGDAASWVWK